ncbi:AMP-binding enzyme [Sistotremastrum suecicum HHB10207 ss-3]|uniref:AMP-binding enzyme n=1 Tax=Sistotremastrum suecicum HHB10207 ss-3 TaxID=1314776 RepID=A0A166GGM0_9AGAM|nr:AMP-binding enzyme [Sistotremastrum suecicum HHB10207 ss-3]
MPIQSPRPTIKFPTIDILTWIFDDETSTYDRSKPLFVNASNPEEYLTKNYLKELTMKIGHGLRELAGVKPGDVVLCASPNHLLYPAVVFGTLCASAIFTGADPSHTEFELSRQLQSSGAKVIFASATTLSVVSTCAARLSISTVHIFLIDGARDGFRGVEDLLNFEGQNWPRLTTFQEVSSTTAFLTYSSGTSGLPKGCEVTHWNAVSHGISFLSRSHRSSAQKFDPENKNPTPITLVYFPLFRAVSIFVSMITGTRSGNLTYILDPQALSAILDAIQRFRINDLIIFPSIAVPLAKSPIVKEYDLACVTQLLCGGSPLGSEVALAVEQALDPDGSKKLRLCQAWGLTEITTIATAFDHGDWDEETQRLAVGPLLSGVEAKIVDGEGAEGVQGELGEIWLRAPFVFKGYWNNDEATRETLTPDGWLKTGDIGKTDYRGFFYIIDRKKEMIKVHGLQVAPAELEATLLSNPDVADAGVIGVPCDRDGNYGGEFPRAYIVKSNSEATASSIDAWMAKHLAPHKSLSGGIEFIHAIPRNTFGKVVRRSLQDWAAESRANAPVISRT